MIHTNDFESNNDSGSSREPDFQGYFHRITCIFSALIAVYYLLMCVLSFSGALQDMKKFGGLGFSYSLGYYLVNNSFPEAMQMFLPVTAEFLFYLVLYRRAEQKKRNQGSIWYFSLMLILHIVIWLHANSLDIPESPPFITADGFGLRYYFFTTITVLQAIVYLVLFVFRVRKF